MIDKIQNASPEQQQLQTFNIKQLRLTESMQQEFQYYEKLALSFNFYLHSLLRRSMMALKKQNDYQLLHRKTNILYYYKKFKQGCQQSKLQKIEKKICFKRIISAMKNQRKMKQQRQQANIFHKKQTIWKVFKYLKQQSLLGKNGKIHRKILMKKYFQEFLTNCRKFIQTQHIKSQQNSNLRNIHENHLLRNYFNNMKIYTKYSQIFKMRQKKELKAFVIYMNFVQKKQNVVIEKFQHHIINQRYFERLKRNRIFNIIERKKQKMLINACFRAWKAEYIFNQEIEQINQSSQEILSAYKKLKQHSIISKAFTQWKKQTTIKIEQKQQKRIVSQYAYIKQKEYLQKKYFEALIMNMKYNKSHRFHTQNLKNKTIEGLKINLLKNTQNLSKVQEFVTQRYLRKYFKAILLFNQTTTNLIHNHQLQKAYNKFTLGLIKIYYAKSVKAQKYHQQNLKFKVFYGLVKQRQFKRNSQKCIAWVNVNSKLRNWRKSYRVRKFNQQRTFFMMKKMFLEWKIHSFRKTCTKNLYSQKNINSEDAVGKVLIYDNMTPNHEEQTPSKFVRLSYSDWCQSETSRY